MTTPIIAYEQVDSLGEGDLRKILGKQAEGKNVDQMKARVKGMLRADEDKPTEQPPAVEDPQNEIIEQMTTISVSKLDQVLAVVERQEKRIEDLQSRYSALEAMASSRKSSFDKKARQEENHTICRVSDYFRDILAEQKWYIDNPDKRLEGYHYTSVLERTFQIEAQAWDNGRYAPCAKNGGLYYLNNSKWVPSPRTGKMRPPVAFNRHLFIAYTMKGELPNPDYSLVDVHGRAARPFAEHLPKEDVKAMWAKGDARQAPQDERLNKQVNTVAELSKTVANLVQAMAERETKEANLEKR